MSLTKEQKNKRFDEIVKVLKSQSEVIDEVIALSGQQFFNDNKGKENFNFEVIEGQNESYRFMGGNDVRYDRYVFPFNYSLWYLPKRINILLQPIIYTILKNESKEILLIDLGAGTGATQIAVALVCIAMKELGYEVPKVTIHNIDLSPFMLNYGKDYVWKYFLQQYPDFENNRNFITKYHTNSWENVKIENLCNIETWLVTSFLFDYSDNNSEEKFKALISTYKPKTIITSTSETKKKKIQKGLPFLETFDKFDFLPLKDKPKEEKVEGKIYGLSIPNNTLEQTTKFRKKLYYTDKIIGTGLYKELKWQDDKGFVCSVFTQKTDYQESTNNTTQELSFVDVRPIFVFYKTEEELINKFKLIFDIYSKTYQLDTITIIDKGDISHHLKLYENELDSNDLQVESLGKLCLLWNANKKIENPKIKTKINDTSGVLVFAFSKENETNIKKVNAYWNVSNIIFWDKKSKDKFLEFKKVAERENNF
ncbi:MAG: hypothetical protein EAZ06_00310 [Cytophagales bacterium]|nr:MAG: hypothetical protein EAZ06_00310 [Cytophagales bacterium]